MSERSLTSRDSSELAMKRKNQGRIPFVIWNNKIPTDNFAKKMLDAGACIIVKSHVYTTGLKSIEKEEKRSKTDEGLEMKQTIYHTAKGDIEETLLICSGSQTPVRHLFKGPEDYDAIFDLIEDYKYTPCYERFVRDDELYGKQGMARPETEKSPFFEIIYKIMGIMNFSIEWHENKEKIYELYKALVETRKKRLTIVADSPARYCVVDGNIEMSVVGNELFEEFYTPDIIEACKILNPKGIVTGLHLDGNNRFLLDKIAPLPVGAIESFTPPPDCDTTLAEGLRIWHDKSFIVNFPASLHLLGAEEVKKNVLSILDEGRDSGRVILGVLENVPKNDFLLMLARIVAEKG